MTGTGRLLVGEHVDIAAPPAEVWRALLDPAERDRWWSGVLVDLVAGGRLREEWTDHAGTVNLTEGEVVAVREAELLAFRWADETWPAHTDVEPHLRPRDGGSRVTVREPGFERLPDGDALARARRGVAPRRERWTTRVARASRLLTGVMPW